MKFKNVFLSFVLIPFSFISFSQEQKSISKSQILFPIASDCYNAIHIPFGKKGSYGLTAAPSGCGTKQEIISNKTDKYFFEKEHNSSWYYFDIQTNGELAFEIIPEKQGDDYDFLLFKYTDSSFCDKITGKKILAVRTNISRSGKENDGRAGLSSSSSKEFVHAGPGETFSKTIEVKKGERYYLVLDNVYQNGGGHTIKFYYLKQVELGGTVTDDDNKPIKADIALEDYKGNEILKTESNPVTGDWKLSGGLKEGSVYTLTMFNDSSFIESKIIAVDSFSMAKVNYKINNIKVILPKLKGGKKYVLNNINFYGDQDILLPRSLSSVNALYKLMKKNSKMIIRIDGHVNRPGDARNDGWAKQLSEMRANTAYKYLLQKGITSDRMTTIGFGSLYMLYPNAKTDEHQEANRRVEITVISVK